MKPKNQSSFPSKLGTKGESLGLGPRFRNNPSSGKSAANSD